GGFGGNGVSGFGDTSSFGQSTGMNALSSGRNGSANSLGRSSSSGSNSSSSNRNGSLSGSGNNYSNRNNIGRNTVAGTNGRRTQGRNNNMLGMGGMNGLNGMNNMGRNNRFSNRGIGAQQAVRPVIQVELDPPDSLQAANIAQTATTTFSANQLM